MTRGSNPILDARLLAPLGSRRQEPPVADPTRSLQGRPEALGLVPVAMRSEVERATRELGLKLECLAAEDLAVARIESGCPNILLIDADVVARPGDLCRFARSLRPNIRVFVLTWYWSERDEVLGRCGDAILHKPPRCAEWESVFRPCGVLLACQSEAIQSACAARPLIAQPALSAGDRSYSRA